MQCSSAKAIMLSPSPSQSIPQSKFTDSPTTAMPMLNCHTRPLQQRYGRGW